MKSHKVLHLTLKKNWFMLMLKGTKKIEYRRPSEWIKQRLVGKEYDFIKFVNGYGADKPFFIAEFLGYEISKKKEKINFKDNSPIEVNPGDFKILLGKVIEKGNLK